ncbi:MAG: hypothetical protein EB168_11030, partial [Euryarchaeota archaeon]|nr:hypothetical protein [Euryarchaeota archaeon]
DDGISWPGVSQSGNWSSVATDGNGTWVIVGQSGVRTSTDNAVTWTTPTGTDLQSKHYDDVTYANGIFLSIAANEANPLMVTSTDGVTWTETTTTLPNTRLWKTAFGNGTWVATEINTRGFYSTDDGATWTQISTGNGWAMSRGDAGVAFGAGLFAVMSRGRKQGQYSEDGINWYNAVTPSADDFTQIRYGGGKFVVVGLRLTSIMSFTYGAAVEGGLFINGKMIATEENLAPLIDAINGLSANRSLFLTDSDPTSLGDSDIRTGQFWYNTETSILSVRTPNDSTDSDASGWTSVVNPPSVKAIIDSGYVQARVPAGTYVAGGRFIVNTSFTHDSSDPIPSRLVKNLFGIRDITREEAGLYTLTFDSAVNTALQDSYSYIVTTSIDYNEDNPTASTRNVAVYNQDSNKFSL